ncbi:hypothetical protein JMJ77_0006955 [Colletotrichum scovillei]|uniref:Uncharacterized protein n=1 Tax=Colletotrichum scovillei TaxID=1209932 RepID=A0A9P7UIE5_9PEZI|nr:hypothetical protein JMJ77_0006955 [Colletotrichum scovillei]KAG7073916.1 hypothetical protein JMJ76_0010410 [Colletotrichum scovillei]KAG7081465.1 hypothetical protein JMJ78_0003587 [Colletotrichum scovillei]
MYLSNPFFSCRFLSHSSMFLV